jgi:hypothetical protein
MLTETLSIGSIDRTLEGAMGAHWRQYGIGPSNILEMDRSGADRNPDPGAVYPPAS